MSLVAVVGARSSGTTTAAVALAAAWPGGRGLVAECDPDGGCLALAAGQALDPGLGSLAVAARPGATGGLLTRHLQRLGGGPPVLFGPVGPDQAGQTVTAVAGTLVQLADNDGWVCLADCGRLHRGSAAGQLPPQRPPSSWSSMPQPKGSGTPRPGWRPPPRPGPHRRPCRRGPPVHPG